MFHNFALLKEKKKYYLLKNPRGAVTGSNDTFIMFILNFK